MTMQHLVKKIFDILCSAILLILLAPVLLLVALITKFILGSPIIFTQERVGLNERIFKIYKFRTMLTDTNLTEKDRIPPWGNLMRKLSLDEIPQLYNILKGDLSLVGPRPLLPEYLPLYSAEQKKRHQVMPGITGWAQVHGRNSISWKEKFELDLWYVKHNSFWLDLKILLLTISVLFKPSGVNSEKDLTMPKFNGKN
jgi:sugar transferase EpsL